MKQKYVIMVGYYEPRRKCTVTATSPDEAFMKARSEMDRRYEKADREPPVGYDLNIIEVK